MLQKQWNVSIHQLSTRIIDRLEIVWEKRRWGACNYRANVSAAGKASQQWHWMEATIRINTLSATAERGATIQRTKKQQKYAKHIR